LPVTPEQLLRRLGNDEDPAVRQSALRALQASPEIAGLPAAERRKRLKIQPSSQRRPEKPIEASNGTGAAEVDPGFDVLPALERELRASLRGRTIEELAQLVELPIRALEHSIERGIAEGRLVRRGAKVYVG
jgi:hypothetical protein